jgi:hypothetical protein
MLHALHYNDHDPTLVFVDDLFCKYSLASSLDVASIVFNKDYP